MWAHSPTRDDEKSRTKNYLRGARNGRIFTAEKKNNPEGLTFFEKEGHMADTRIIYQPIIVQTMRTGTVSYVGNLFFTCGDYWELILMIPISDS